jgi:thiol-disulfide isomerase/thioredoxin
VLRGLGFALLAISGRVEAPPRLLPAHAAEVRAAIRKPGARAVLLNVWATWCDPCREEMPALVRFYRAHEKDGLRLVLVSADFPDGRADAEKFLAAQGIDFPTFLKTGDDMAFIDGIDRRWTGALPASFLFDGHGHVQQFWPRPVTFEELTAKLDEILKRRKP